MNIIFQSSSIWRDLSDVSESVWVFSSSLYSFDTSDTLSRSKSILSDSFFVTHGCSSKSYIFIRSFAFLFRMSLKTSLISGSSILSRFACSVKMFAYIYTMFLPSKGNAFVNMLYSVTPHAQMSSSRHRTSLELPVLKTSGERKPTVPLLLVIRSFS